MPRTRGIRSFKGEISKIVLSSKNYQKVAKNEAKISVSGQTCGQNEKTDIFGMSLSRILEGFKSNKKPQKARKTNNKYPPVKRGVFQFRA